MNFLKRYNSLNSAQKQAVDTIEGPVMVIAGPGTGKTELLGVRVANILQKTDTLPENILCLTYTESGATAMRKRLADIIGRDAYKVAVHTFHSFGAEILNQNNQYFYQGAEYKVADSLNSYQIIHEIFDSLDYNSPIASKNNGEHSYLKEAQSIITEFKRSGFTSDEVIDILNENDATIEKTEQLLSPIFSERINKKMLQTITPDIINEIRNSGQFKNPNITPLSNIIADSLSLALDEAIETNKTGPLTAWKNKWFKYDSDKKQVLRSKEYQLKLRSMCYVYDQYISKMHEASLYDFDDMILRVVHAMEIFNELRFNLQEKYQYIMVDEFQDTNLAQMRIITSLTNNQAHGDTPNILVVGDDDQAIYGFQGAEVSNILNFKHSYPKLKTIVLTENYRSTADILEKSRNVIVQGVDRLENSIKDLSKKLSANYQPNDSRVNVRLYEAESLTQERNWLANDIKNRIKSGAEPSKITVIARHHKELVKLLPYLYKNSIDVNYERRDNVLDLESICFLEQLSDVLINIYRGRHDEVNAKLPELLAHKMWQIDPLELWKLSLKAHKNKLQWLEVMADTPSLEKIQKWLVVTAMQIENISLEQILDIIIGKIDQQSDDDDFVSPFYDYYFSKEKLAEDPSLYLLHLEGLRTIRTKLREYQTDQKPTLLTFIEFIKLNRKISATITMISQSNRLENAINLMTAHSSKGLEFDDVYIINSTDNVWGEKAKSKNRMIKYPDNLPLASVGETSDERLRLFYVAMTRAKKSLIISYSSMDSGDKSTLKASFLMDAGLQVNKIEPNENLNDEIENAEIAWYQPLIEPKKPEMLDLLKPMLENYKLSATHLNSFLDVSRGGPSTFLINNLLRFPQGKSAHAIFGTLIHNTLQRAHNYVTFSDGKKQAIEDILTEFETNLKNEYLESKDYETYSQKGSDILRTFFEEKYDSFSPGQKTELSFASQQSIVGEAHLTGNIDLADIDAKNRTIVVTDYKTGKPATSWKGHQDYEKSKLHKYRQQLLFYKLLIENARDYRNYSVEKGIMQFVEPTKDGKIIALEDDFDKDALDRLVLLINAVYKHIVDFNLPDTSSYEPNLKGTLAFEQDLIDGVI